MQRMMASKTVEVGVITYGNSQEKTNNYLNESMGGYDGVNEVIKMGRPSTSTLSIINSISEETDSSEELNHADIIDGIVVAQDVLIRTNKAKHSIESCLFLQMVRYKLKDLTIWKNSRPNEECT